MGEHPQIEFAALVEHWLRDVLLHHPVPPGCPPHVDNHRLRVCEAQVHAAGALGRLHHPVIVLPSISYLRAATASVNTTAASDRPM